MFSKSTLKKETTPKRVYSLLKLVEYKKGKVKKEEIFNYIQPMKINNNQSEVKGALKFCIDEELLKQDFDGNIKLNIDKKHLEDEKAFRRFINSDLYADIDKNVFYEINRDILKKGMELYENDNLEQVGITLDTINAKKDNMLAWRFWASYLGYGFMMNSLFILNPYIRIRDVINEKFTDKFNVKMTIKEFISELRVYSPEFSKAIKDNRLSVPLSLALITLNDLDFIKLDEIRDSEDRWTLDLNESIKIITHVEIFGGQENE